LETLNLARAGALGAALGNAASSLVLCLAAAWLGFAAAGLVDR
jgi:fluoride ion exporter CrcB/FEX